MRPRCSSQRLILGATERLDLLEPLESSGRDDLLVTVETFLDLAGDVSRTGARLHLHRSTVYYRLGLVEQALGVDLRRGRDRLDLHLALLARRLR